MITVFIVAEQIINFLPNLEALKLGTKSKPLLDDLVLSHEILIQVYICLQILKKCYY